MSAPLAWSLPITSHSAPVPTASSGSGAIIDSIDWLMPAIICWASAGIVEGQFILTSWMRPFVSTR